MPEHDLAALETIRSEVKRPADFDAFWRGVKDELARTPLEWERIPDATWTTPELTVDWLRFSSLGGHPIYGWLAVPRETAADGNVGYLWLPGYSYGSPPPRAESLYPGTVTLGLNLHGNTPDTPYVHPASLGREYITQGIESPETYLYRDIVAHCVRALDVLAAQPEVDPAKRVVGGMSQGGGLALVTAALAPQVQMCFADMPWLCDLDRALSLIDRERYKRLANYRIPDGRALIEDYADAHPERSGQIFQTYRYFDPLSHAADIHCPTQMSAGGRDPSCKPPTIFAVYNALDCEKEMLYLPRVGHEIVPAMHEAHAKWVQRL
jgi:cephalosporin-C deacetylase